MRLSHYVSALVLVGAVAAAIMFATSVPPRASAAAPDLVIDSVALDPTQPLENQSVAITITVRNRGDASTGEFGEFWVDFYADLAAAPNPRQVGDDFCDMDAMGPASTATCEVSHIFNSFGTHNFWVQTDTDAEILESNENNNISGPNTIDVLPDSDFDSVGDPNDNCLDEPNPGQENVVHPGTTLGDACEDPDADDIFDSTDNCPDIANTNQADGDGDADGDVCDNCPAWPNPSQALPSWSAGVPLIGTGPDSDCDRFSDSRETYLITDPTKQCALTGVVTPPPPNPPNPPGSGLNDEPLPDRWPVDMNDNQSANTPDVGQFVFSLNSRANQNPPDPRWNQRHDLNGNGIVNTGDVGAYVFVLNRSCSPSGP